ncbi:MAG: YdcF family protein, partial [Corynebacterium sp.]|nr:YdcF family protein [Corynebacterium sp.]
YCPSQFPDRSWWESVVHESGGLFVLDVSRLAGPAAADMLETTLRRLQLLLKPSRRDRFEQLEDTDA